MITRRGEGSVYQRGNVFWIQYYRNGKPYRESSYSAKEAEARKLLKRRLAEIAVGRFIVRISHHSGHPFRNHSGHRFGAFRPPS